MSGRVALVTGGSRGIGREAALLLSAAGTRVMIASRNAAELAALDKTDKPTAVTKLTDFLKTL